MSTTTIMNTKLSIEPKFSPTSISDEYRRSPGLDPPIRSKDRTTSGMILPSSWDASGLMWAKKRDAMTTAAAPSARLWADRVPDAVMSTTSNTSSHT